MMIVQDTKVLVQPNIELKNCTEVIGSQGKCSVKMQSSLEHQQSQSNTIKTGIASVLKKDTDTGSS